MAIRIYKAIGYIAPHPDLKALHRALDNDQVEGEVASLLDDRKKYGTSSPNCNIYKQYPNIYKYPKFFSDVVLNCNGGDRFDDYLIIPPGYVQDWYRSDNSIDYIEEMLAPDHPRERLQILSDPLYPFNGWLRLDGTDAPEYGTEEYWEEFNGNSHLLMPMIPKSVRAIATHLGFNNWIELRPVFASWWA